MASVKADFISGASNRVANCFALKSIAANSTMFGGSNVKNHSSYSDVVFYGVGNSVALSCLNNYKGIELTIQGHTGRVNCVSLLEYGSESEDFEIISGSSDKTIRIWSKNSENNWKCAATLSEHTDSIIYLKTIFMSPSSGSDFTHVFASCSVDGSVKIWKRFGKGGEAKCIQTIEHERHIPFSLILAELPSLTSNFCESDGGWQKGVSNISDVYLATGNTDSKIHFFIWDQETQVFKKSLVLEGHEDWITSLSSTTFSSFSMTGASNSAISHWNSGDVILATASQDRYCRLWKISRSKVIESVNELHTASKKDEILAALQTGDATQLSVRIHSFTVGEKAYKLELESVLSGHDDWIHSVSWQSPKSTLDNLQLITASADQSILLWKPEAESGVWSSEARLGEVGGSVYGFFNSVLRSDGKLIVAVGYHGSLHVWRSLDTDDDGDLNWVQDVSPTGHFEPVTDIQWEPYGRYFLTHSLDKTARIFANWKNSNEESGSTGVWHEISRPQIHGYELNCVTFVNSFTYASGADEKVVRVFEAPSHFSEIYNHLCINSSLDEQDRKEFLLGTHGSAGTGQAIEAVIPPLGLSNKAIFQDEIDAEAQKSEPEEEHEIRRKTHVESYVSQGANESGAVSFSALHPAGHPPLEESLRRRTLWPEVEKVYGHPYETFAIASSSINSYDQSDSNDIYDHRSQKAWLAVSCKAKSAKNAGVRLYDNLKWRPAQLSETQNGQRLVKDAAPLMAHTLTVTKMAFQPNLSQASSHDYSALLLAVGRDRSISLFRMAMSRDTENETPSCESIQLFQHVEKAHLRIVWDCAWSPDGKFFVTVSRDKTLKVWVFSAEANEFKVLNSVKLAESGTSVSVTTEPSSQSSYWIAVGLEDGAISVFKLACPTEITPSSTLEVSKLLSFPLKISHSSKVNRLGWRPVSKFSVECNSATQRQLASCSDDHTVRLFTISI